MLIISGCYPLPVYVDNDSQEKTEVFVVGETTKDDVRNLLGSPTVVQEDLNVEVFGVESKLGAVLMLYYIPIWYESSYQRGYVLVEYKDDVLSGFDLGMAFSLSTNNFIYDITNRSLLAKSEYAKHILNKETNNICKIFIAPNKVGSIFINEDRLGHGYDSNGYFYKELPSGKHQIEVCGNSTVSYSNSPVCPEPKTFQCIDNEIIYFHVYTESSFLSRYKKEKVAIHIDKSQDTPEWIYDRNLIIGQGHVVFDYSPNGYEAR